MPVSAHKLSSILALPVAMGTLSPAIGPTAARAAAVTPAAAEALYTPDTDPLFAQPYIDIDEWRDAPVRHRYVHGGFKGTDTRFSFYFPPKEQYQGRFFQHVTPVPDSENLAQAIPAGPYNKIGSSIAAGAYFVETNGGGKIDPTKGSLALADPTITAFKANAATATYSRKLAVQMYGGKRPYGYVYGGSGGAFRTIGSIESTHGVWDGAVPYVVGSTMAIPNMFTVRMHALRVLRDKFPQIIDAMEPGGSGDPYVGLTPHEASVLHEIDRMGFPMKSWFGYKTMGLHGFAALYGGVAMADPTYFTDFWTKPGYLGHDHPEYFAKDRVQFKATVAAPITAAEAARLGLSTNPLEQQKENRGGVDNAYKGPPGEANKIVGFRLTQAAPPAYFLGGEVVVGSGAVHGKRLMADNLIGDVVLLGFVDPAAAAQIKPGDAVTIDNSNFLAMETYHRHQVPGADFKVWDQFRGPDGKPIYPQRPMILGPIFVKSTAGTVMTGQFEGKMIIAASLWDREAMPWQADWYRQRVAGQPGVKDDDKVRLYYTDHALHGDEPTTEAASRIVSYVPTLQQALIDLAAWVEKGTPPPASTNYRVVDGQVIVPPTAAARGGIQPVVTLQVGGRASAQITAGQSVRLTGTIDVPSDAGSAVAAEWDFEGTGQFQVSSPIKPGTKRATVTTTHRFDKPGTYFVGLRGASQRRGDASALYGRVQNLARVRIVVR